MSHWHFAKILRNCTDVREGYAYT